MKTLFRSILLVAAALTLAPSLAEAQSTYGTVAQGGTPLARRRVLNFAGSPISCVDNSGAKRTDCTVTASTAPVTPVRAVSTANVASRSGAATVDGVSCIAGDRVLLVAQSTASQNGIWVLQSGAWTRPSDWITGAIVAGIAVEAGSEGTSWANSTWKVTTSGAITVDTTSITLYPRAQRGQATLSAGGATISNLWILTGATVVASTTSTTTNVIKVATTTAGAGNGSQQFAGPGGSSDVVNYLILNW